MLVVVINDRLLLPILDPPVARDLPVVRVGLAVTMFPVVILAGRQADPAEQLADSDLRPFSPILDVINDLVSCIRGNPATFQSSPLAFFERMFSSISSAITSFLDASFSRNAARSCSRLES